MPIIKSAIKRAKQTITRRSHNLQVKRAVHEDIRKVVDAIEAGDATATQAALREAQSEIDRAVKKGTLHKNTAARRKSRLAAKAATVLGDAKPAKAEKTPTATKPKAAPKAAAKKPAAKAASKTPAKKAA